MTVPIFSFVRSKSDATLAENIFCDAFGSRLSLITVLRDVDWIKPIGANLWIDLSLDFIANLYSARHTDQAGITRIRREFEKECHGSILQDRLEVGKKQSQEEVKEAIGAMTERVSKYNPDFIGAPLFPYDGSKGTSKANRTIVDAIIATKKGMKWILPVVIQGRDLTHYKKFRSEIVKEISEICAALRPSYVWIVDASLNDDLGTGTMAKERLPFLVRLHEEFRTSCPEVKVVAGPYWGMNIVLWARGLADLVGVTPGGGWQYYPDISLNKHTRPAVRIALPPLRRLVKKVPELEQWLEVAVLRKALPEQARQSFEKLKENFKILDGDVAKSQVAEFYLDWVKGLCNLPEQGRAFGLYQDLSAAYAVGSLMPRLGGEKGAGANPAHVAEILMLNVLGS